jgi:hypothetical protein
MLKPVSTNGSSVARSGWQDKRVLAINSAVLVASATRGEQQAGQGQEQGGGKDRQVEADGAPLAHTAEVGQEGDRQGSQQGGERAVQEAAADEEHQAGAHLKQ